MCKILTQAPHKRARAKSQLNIGKYAASKLILQEINIKTKMKNNTLQIGKKLRV